jgi:hypothetical protein
MTTSDDGDEATRKAIERISHESVPTLEDILPMQQAVRRYMETHVPPPNPPPPTLEDIDAFRAAVARFRASHPGSPLDDPSFGGDSPSMGRTRRSRERSP